MRHRPLQPHCPGTECQKTISANLACVNNQNNRNPTRRIQSSPVPRDYPWWLLCMSTIVRCCKVVPGRLRASLLDATIEYSNEFARDLIVFHTAPVINGRNITKEYFALGNDRLRFIRLENDKGELARNEYVFPNYEIGIAPDAHTVEQWSALLESKDKADVLSALVFLGGKHRKSPNPWTNRAPQQLRQRVG
jgi:hypothetical protein